MARRFGSPNASKRTPQEMAPELEVDRHSITLLEEAAIAVMRDYPDVWLKVLEYYRKIQGYDEMRL